MSGITAAGICSLDNGIELCRLECGQRSFPPHFHEYWLIGCLLHGKRYFWCDGKRYLLQPLQIVTLNPGQVHTCTSISENSPDDVKKECSNSSDVWICIHILPAAWKDIIPDAPSKFPYFSRNVLYQSKMSELMVKLEKKSSSSMSLVHNLKMLLPRMINCHRPRLIAPQHKIEVSEKITIIDKLCEYLAANVENEICLEEMALLTKMDKFRLLRKFVQERRITPYRYLESLRIAKATTLLKQGQPLVETSLAVGFYDQSHFCRRFKQYTGLTPGSFREWQRVDKKRRQVL